VKNVGSELSAEALERSEEETLFLLIGPPSVPP
jgi:hypothetical protein